MNAIAETLNQNRNTVRFWFGNQRCRFKFLLMKNCSIFCRKCRLLSWQRHSYSNIHFGLYTTAVINSICWLVAILPVFSLLNSLSTKRQLFFVVLELLETTEFEVCPTENVATYGWLSAWPCAQIFSSCRGSILALEELSISIVPSASYNLPNECFEKIFLCEMI